MKNRFLAVVLLLALLWGTVSGSVLGAAADTSIRGDVDGSGKVNTVDARLTLQYAAGRIGASGLDLSAADVDNNNKVNTVDARMILQYAANRISSLNPIYREISNVPDFGAMYGVPEDYRSYEEGYLFVAYTYADISRVDADWDILIHYMDILLDEYGFYLKGTTEDDNGWKTFWLENGDRSITLLLGFADSFWFINIFDNMMFGATFPTYSEIPSIPDFGIMYGVPEFSHSYEDGFLFVSYTYTDISRVDKEMDILIHYKDILVDVYGFRIYKTEDNDYGGTNFWLENRDGSLTVAIGFTDNLWSIGVFDNTIR